MKMKTIKFRRELADLIIAGEKTTTWRLFDDKDLCEGEEVSFVVWENGNVFARAKLIKVYGKTLGTLDDADWDGHEKFASHAEMYKTYETYYHQAVNANSSVKIIIFEIIKFLL